MEQFGRTAVAVDFHLPLLGLHLTGHKLKRNNSRPSPLDVACKPPDSSLRNIASDYGLFMVTGACWPLFILGMESVKAEKWPVKHSVQTIALVCCMKQVFVKHYYNNRTKTIFYINFYGK